MTSNVTISRKPDTNLNQALVESCKKGDQKAQFQIYKMYYKAMYCASLRMVKNSMEALDIMQESFLSAFERIETYPENVSFEEWLKKIVISLCIESLKKKGEVLFADIDMRQIETCHSLDDMTTDYKADLTEEAILVAC